jgi:hypothetical protein
MANVCPVLLIADVFAVLKRKAVRLHSYGDLNTRSVEGGR